jgi:hypothetical protein
MSECKKGFKAFEYDAAVCDNCGRRADQHPTSAVDDDLTKAMWKVLLAEGGVWSFYGGYFVKAESYGRPGDLYHNEMAKIDIHMTSCEIDWKKTRRPAMTQLGEFNGTFTDTELYQTALAGELFCKCGEIRYEKVGMNEITLGQLIWKVVHADD